MMQNSILPDYNNLGEFKIVKNPTKYKLLNGNKNSGEFSHDDDCAWTIKAHNITVHNSFVQIDFGVGLEIHDDNTVLLFPRSSLTKYNWIVGNSVGVVDVGYRGSVGLRLKPLHPITNILLNINIEDKIDKYSERNGLYRLYSLFLMGLKTKRDNYIKSIFPYKKGDKCGQFLTLKNESKGGFIETNDITKTKRGDGGFGSTGK